MATGKVVLERTRVWLELEGREEIVPAVISNIVDKVLIGVIAMEILGLQVDPITGRLKEWTILLHQALGKRHAQRVPGLEEPWTSNNISQQPDAPSPGRPRGVRAAKTGGETSLG